VLLCQKTRKRLDRQTLVEEARTLRLVRLAVGSFVDARGVADYNSEMKRLAKLCGAKKEEASNLLTRIINSRRKGRCPAPE